MFWKAVVKFPADGTAANEKLAKIVKIVIPSVIERLYSMLKTLKDTVR